MHPRYQATDFIKSVHPDTPNMFYVLSYPARFGSHLGPQMDFEVEGLSGEKPILFTITRGFIDRGVMCVEYRPADWLPQDIMHSLRIRFYSPGVEYQGVYAPSAVKISKKACGKCETCSCKIGEDAAQ
jgi:hypothetical protein